MKPFNQAKKYGAKVVAALVALPLTVGVALADTNPLVTAATTETTNTKADLLAMGGVIIVIAVVTWGIFRLIGMFGRK